MKKFLLSLSVSVLTTTLLAQCDFGAHSINWEDSWLSCEVSANPNPERGEGHWIMYDLGEAHHLYASHIWNLNVAGATGQGVRNCIFDVSLDGEEWESWGAMEIPEAPGDSDYIGVTGPSFDGIVGRYLLLTVDTNWDGSDCAGFAEIKVDIEDAVVNVEESAGIAFNIYPNPATEWLTVRQFAQGTVEAEIFDGAGRSVWSTSLISTSTVVDVSSWETGLYLFMLRDEAGSTSVKRFIVR